MKTMHEKKIIFIKTLTELTGLHRQTIWRYVKAGKFPKPTKIESRNAWYLRDVENWIDLKMGGEQL
jgi:prophage regulatory protein